MFIYLIRHGDAYNDSETGSDRDRKLTELGHRQARAAGNYLTGHQGTPTAVITSPFARARETSESILDSLGLDEIVDDRLGADRGLTEMFDVVADHQDQEVIAIISHNPTIGRLETLLTHGPSVPVTSQQSPGEVVLVKIEGDELIGNGRVIERFRLRA